MCEPPDDEQPRDDFEQPEEPEPGEHDDQGNGHDEPAPTTGDLGLPSNYQDEHIPGMSDLQREAIKALDRELAFVILHREDAPEQIMARLDKLADVVRAACQVKGPHQGKAIRLGLELKMWYWLAADKLDDWMRLIMDMLQAALDMEDEELISRVYQALSMYKHIHQDRPDAAPRILQIAAECATDSKREDLQLLIRAESFNTRALSLSYEEARAEAETILTEARRMKYNLVQGVAYNSLARVCAARYLSGESFTYAQQALVFFGYLKMVGLAGESVTSMLSGLAQMRGLPGYRSQLKTYLENLSRRTANPFLRASLGFIQGRDEYYRGDYDAARQYILDALRQYRLTRHQSSINRAVHMLGMIEAKRSQWEAAEQYLNEAYAYYKQTGEAANAVQAFYALAFIPFEQKDWRRARPLLVETREMAEQLPEEKVRIMFVESIQADIDELDRHLAEEENR